jgi:hypothetical protein
MNETMNTNNCERAGELVAYFYGEANSIEREGFNAHLAVCGGCRDELAAFAGVRKTVGKWRAEILKTEPAISFAEALAPMGVRAGSVAAAAVPPGSPLFTIPQRSALAALREFFMLSPVWLRGVAGTTVFILCALAALTILNAEVRWDNGGLAFSSRLRSEAKTVSPSSQVVQSAEKVYLQAEVDNLITERDAALRELDDTRAQLDNSREANLIAAFGTLEPASASRVVTASKNSRRERRVAPSLNMRQKRFRDERDEEDMPRLYDLLNEAN